MPHLNSGRHKCIIIVHVRQAALEVRKQVLQQEAYPTIWPPLTPKIRPSLGLSPKMGENLSEIRLDCLQIFTPIGKAPAEKYVTVHTKKKVTENIVSHPYYVWRGNSYPHMLIGTLGIYPLLFLCLSTIFRNGYLQRGLMQGDKIWQDGGPGYVAGHLLFW